MKAKRVASKAIPVKEGAPPKMRKPRSASKAKIATLPAPEMTEPVTAAAAALADVAHEAVETPLGQALSEPPVGAPNRYRQRMTIGLSTYQAQKFLLMQRLGDKIESLVASIVPEESGRYDLCLLAEIVEAGSSKP